MPPLTRYINRKLTVRAGVLGAPHLPVVPSLRLSLLLRLIAEPCVLSVAWRAELCRAQCSDASKAESCSCRFFPLTVALSSPKGRRETQSRCRPVTCAYVRAYVGYMVINGTAEGWSCWEKTLKTYWILVQRASEQTKSNGISGAFQRVESTRPGSATAYLEGSSSIRDLVLISLLLWSFLLYTGNRKVTFSENQAHACFTFF